jgi:hypothetical protein
MTLTRSRQSANSFQRDIRAFWCFLWNAVDEIEDNQFPSRFNGRGNVPHSWRAALRCFAALENRNFERSRACIRVSYDVHNRRLRWPLPHSRADGGTPTNDFGTTSVQLRVRFGRENLQATLSKVSMTDPGFCARFIERVNITVMGCEFGFGTHGYRLRGQVACIRPRTCFIPL